MLPCVSLTQRYLGTDTSEKQNINPQLPESWIIWSSALVMSINLGLSSHFHLQHFFINSYSLFSRQLSWGTISLRSIIL